MRARRCRTSRWFGTEEAHRQLADHPRRGGQPVRRGLHPGGRQEQRLGFLLVLQERLEALLSEMVRRLSPLGAFAVPEDGGAAELDSERAWRHVRAAAAGRQARRSPRSLCRLAALPPRAGDAQFGQVPDPGRRRRMRLARRPGLHVRRDLHPQRRKRHRRHPHHPILRRRAADEVRLPYRRQSPRPRTWKASISARSTKRSAGSTSCISAAARSKRGTARCTTR